MELKDFINNFFEQLEETDISEVTSETKFKEIDEWSSLTALSIIAMIDEEYNVQVKGDDIKNANTISDLFEIVKSRS